MTCARCGERPGTAYRFRYGRKVNEERTGNQIKTTYRMGGGEEVVLCDVCLARRRRVTSLPLLAAGLIFGGFALFAYFNPDLGPGEPDQELFWIATVAGAGCLFYFLTQFFTKRQTRGEKLAIATKRRELKGQGWDSYWTSEGKTLW